MRKLSSVLAAFGIVGTLLVGGAAMADECDRDGIRSNVTPAPAVVTPVPALARPFAAREARFGRVPYRRGFAWVPARIEWRHGRRVFVAGHYERTRPFFAYR